MNNAEKFQEVFGYYATEMWAKPESEFLEWINSNYTPTIEVMEYPQVDGITPTLITIVRCKDCRHYHAFKDYAYCTVINVKGKHPQPNDYCSYAEEK